MKIELDPNVALFLETACLQAHGQEVSGFGFVKIEGDTFRIYDAVLLDIGSSVFTEIDPKKILPFMEREDAHRLKLWWHRHPVGNGIPGRHNWSGTDENTCRNEPLGSPPELVKWSISIVRTPNGWVGRYDTYGPKSKTIHLDVTPNEAMDIDRQLGDILVAKKAKVAQTWTVSGPSNWQPTRGLRSTQRTFAFEDTEPCPNCDENCSIYDQCFQEEEPEIEDPCAECDTSCPDYDVCGEVAEEKARIWQEETKAEVNFFEPVEIDDEEEGNRISRWLGHFFKREIQ